MTLLPLLKQEQSAEEDDMMRELELKVKKKLVVCIILGVFFPKQKWGN